MTDPIAKEALMDIFTAEATFPPSLQNNPLLALLTVMGAWIVVLVILQWLYEIVDAMRDYRAPSGSYIAVARRVRFWLLLSCLIAAVPRLGQLMLWRLLDSVQREMLSSAAWVAFIPCAGMVMYSWWADKALVVTERTYVAEHGYLPAAKSTRQDKIRGAFILLVIFAFAFATTYIRPRNDRPIDRTAVVERR